MKIVLTGALGHLGSYLIQILMEQFPDLDLVLVDDFSIGRPQTLFNLKGITRYRFFEADVTRDNLVIPFSGADCVIHLAAWTSIGSGPGLESRMKEINIAGARRVAEACIEADAAMLFPSTTSIYGESSDNIKEDSRAFIHPQTPYASSKYAAEEALGKLVQNEGLKLLILRMGTIFGVSPGMQFQTAVNRFCLQAALSKRVCIWQTALNQMRPYCDVKDAARSMIFLLQRGIFDGSIFHAATTHAAGEQILDSIREEIPGLVTEQVNHPHMNHLSYRISVEKIKHLGFVFEGDLRRGIRETLELFKNARFEAESIF